MNRSLSLTLSLAGVLLVSGCNLAPHYQRPQAPITPQWQEKSVQGAQASSLGWSQFFTDPQLQQLIRLALENNRDLRIAALNVEASRAQLGMTQADLLPSISGTVTKTAEHLPGNLYSTQSTGPVTYQQYEATGSASWELDFFGKLRNLREAALEQYLSDQATQQATQLSLVAQVVSAYITLATDSDLHQLAINTAASQQASFNVVQKRLAAGLVTEQDELQARTALVQAQADIVAYDRARRQAAYALQRLLGTTLPTNIASTSSLSNLHVFPALSSELPSQVLTRRPDILAAEHTLKAANANIGAARAAFFPSISLTATGGSLSGGLSQLLGAGTGGWTFMPTLSVPIFEGGKNRATLDLATVTARSDVAAYEKAIQVAFQEVSDALVGRETYQQEVGLRAADVATNQHNYALAQRRYQDGIDSYLDVLIAQRSLYSTQQTYITVLSSSLAQQVTLYKVLGGGWH
ncbi:efflux transporter outer membrane subunit [Rosenbergiella australiborealis]|uniref:efflux transporter outer membrane subunit n=1 Tax=Rosenbergiella australiborealis TaxID=1544696 RepID=UPI001F4D5E46|nr:efflux transporter outer membrane subunit [Rosenbergiella australiborealis]